MSNAAVEITNLLYRYAEHIDGGRLEDAAGLFAHARIRTTGGEIDAAGLLDLWRRTMRIHDDGTPLTKHVVTNPILEIDEESGVATCRSYYTVLQQTPTLPLQVVASGRYHDEFARVDGVWRFSHRDYTLFDFPGDLREHLTVTFGG